MNYIGISTGFHDSGLSLVDDQGNILFAGHGERYSKVKHDKNLCELIADDALSYITDNYQVHYYENPILKYLRQLRSGEKSSLSTLSARNIIGAELYLIQDKKIHCHCHHLSHAAAGFQTSPFDKATVVVIDAIGEWDTVSIWAANYVEGVAKYKKLWSRKYPHSIGLFYSAFTQRVGLKPLDEEYILMGMSGWGKPTHSDTIKHKFISSMNDVIFKENMHVGIDGDFLNNVDDLNIASSTQSVLEEIVYSVMRKASNFDWSENLVYMGGVALNCLANRNLGNYFSNIWIMPNPGDAGSSLGAAALGYGKKLNWVNAYLGYNIPSKIAINDVVDHLLEYKLCGIASGRAEWGPRALGNRSLLADPRPLDIKDRVNDIKKRQRFRPFAPVILEEHADTYFEIPSGWVDSRYMQIVGKCKQKDRFPAIVHVDGTSRIQTVPNDGSTIRLLLEEWYNKTSCPMLLNTSLNIRGEPMVNDRNDADRFEKLYGVKVFS